jgi:hypothetical protein
MTLIRSIEKLHVNLTHLLRIFHEARKYKDLEVCTDELSFVYPMKPLPEFMDWMLSHTKPMMSSLRVVGKNTDLTKTICAHFLVSELPFDNKDVGVHLIRDTLDKIHKAHHKDKIVITTALGNTSHVVKLPREMEVTLVYQTALTSDAAKHLADFRDSHPRLTITELSLNNHLRGYLLNHPCMPRSLRRLNKKETKDHTPPLLKLNTLFEDSVEVVLIGGVPGDVIESTIALKNGTNLVQYWKIIPKPKKKPNK